MMMMMMIMIIPILAIQALLLNQYICLDDEYY